MLKNIPETGASTVINIKVSFPLVFIAHCDINQKASGFCGKLLDTRCALKLLPITFSRSM